MKVKLRTNYASADLTAHAGQVIDVSATEAKDLVNGGYAETAEAPAAKEQATKEPASEKRETK